MLNVIYSQCFFSFPFCFFFFLHFETEVQELP
uniref:Uncharacterized protein n=1 Tax=Anguilla anguilla TaxID=7936 RepID=A0A0E9R913_ANGAN